MQPATPTAGLYETIRLGEGRSQDLPSEPRPLRLPLARRVQLTTTAGGKQPSARRK